MNGELKWVMLTELSGMLEAEMFKTYLESQEIPSQLFHEATSAYALTIGQMGLVQVYVPTEKFDEASALLESYLNEQEGTDNEMDDSSMEE